MPQPYRRPPTNPGRREGSALGLHAYLLVDPLSLLAVEHDHGRREQAVLPADHVIMRGHLDSKAGGTRPRTGLIGPRAVALRTIGRRRLMSNATNVQKSCRIPMSGNKTRCCLDPWTVTVRAVTCSIARYKRGRGPTSANAAGLAV